MITCFVDTTKAVQVMEALNDAMVGSGQDASNLVRDESRRLCRTIVNFTPPLKGQGNPQKVGEAAVERDLKSLFSEATTGLIDEVGSKYGIHNINRAYVTERDGTRLNLQWDNLDVTGERMKSFHLRYRNNRGRVPKPERGSGVWRSRVVVPIGTRQPYIDKVKARVGRWKASWAYAGMRLGDRFPSWISKHFSTIDNEAIADVVGLTEKENPHVVFGSRTAGNSRLRARIQAALGVRIKAMANRTRLILSGYKEDVARGIRPKSGKVKGGPEEAID